MITHSLDIPAAPVVTVAVCTYNRLAYLREAVKSILAQTFRDIELVVCDDASADETPAYCEDLRRRDDTVRVVRHGKNVGIVPNWNSGLHAGRGG